MDNKQDVCVGPSEANRDQEALEMKRRIYRFLHERDFHALRRIDVEVQGGCATLSGRVASFYAKQLAISCCRRVAGIRNVVDEIRVSEGAS